ncbi:MAG: glycosyltransferase, partial [Deltaproteobacteria bacterium]|nr:glycosyltransferase [Deltaproteobacteria bacterium]
HISNYEVHYFGRESGEGYFNLPNCHLIQGPSETRTFERALYTITGRSKRLLREIKSVSPVLLHAHFGVEGVYALSFARSLGIPLVTTFHGFDATVSVWGLVKTGKVSWIRYAAYINRLKKQGKCFIAVSEYVRRKLIERGFPAERTIVHYVGIDPHRFTPGSNEDDGRTVLTVGRLVENKGTEYLIRAIAMIRSEFPTVQLEVVGDGPLFPSLQRLAAELGVSRQIVFRASLTYDEVASCMKKASVFCLPSVTAKNGAAEGLGLVLLEAAASLKPVVGTFNGGIPEAVNNGVNGFLVPERDVHALADRILSLLKNRTLRREMGNAGRKRVERDFNLFKQSRKLEHLYQKIIKTNAHPQPQEIRETY